MLIHHSKIGGGRAAPGSHGCVTSGVVGSGVHGCSALGPRADLHQVFSQYYKSISGAHLAYRLAFTYR